MFYRTNAQSRVFEEVFIRVGLPYKVVGGVRFYERREVRDALAYLRVLANPEDTVSLRRIINVPKRGIGDRAEACLEALAAARADHVRRRRCAAARTRRARHPVARRGAGRSAQLMDDLRTLVEAGTGPATVLEAVLERTGYLAELAGSADPQDETRLENLAGAGRRRPGVRGGRARERRRPRPTSWSRSRWSPTPTRSPTSPTRAEGRAGVVTLMTLHTAKGLEFPVVFLTGLEDGVFPHLRSLGDPNELEEERRLAYVGITRAQQRLYLSRAVVRSAWGAPQYNPRVAVPGGDARRAGRLAPRRSRRVEPRAGDRRGSLRAPACARPATGRSIHLEPGDRVTHDTFGMGTVVTVEGVGERAVATVDFRAEGVKRLLLRYAPVEKL